MNSKKMDEAAWPNVETRMKGPPDPNGWSATQTFSPSATTPRAFEPSSAIAAESVTLTLPLDIAHVANHTRQKVFYLSVF